MDTSPLPSHPCSGIGSALHPGHCEVLHSHGQKGLKAELSKVREKPVLTLGWKSGNNSPLGEQNLLEGRGRNAISQRQARRNCCWKAYLSREESDIRLCQASGPTHKVPPTSPAPSQLCYIASIDRPLLLTPQWAKEREPARLEASKLGVENWGCFCGEEKRKGRKGVGALGTELNWCLPASLWFDGLYSF